MTKIITITIGDQPAGDCPSGWIIIHHMAPEGGRTSIGAQIGEGRTHADAASLLLNGMGRSEWPSFIKGAVNGNRLRMTAPDFLDKATFAAEFNPAQDQSGKPVPNPDWITILDEVF